MAHIPSPRAACSALAILAAVALSPVVVSRSQSAADAAPVPTTTTELPLQETTVTAQNPTTTTSGAAAPSSTTSTTNSPTTTTTTAAVTRTAAAASPTQLEQVEAIADNSGFDWRAAGVTFHVAYHPDDCCHWGIYDYRDNSLWIGPSAFATSSRLRYVVLHELAHAWQWASGRRGELAGDMAPWGYSGNEALEYSADCVATIWGATTENYWSCPATAEALVARRLAGDWS